MSLVRFRPLTPKDEVLRLLRRHPSGRSMFQLINTLRFKCETKDVVRAVQELLDDGTIAITSQLFWIRDK